MILFPIPNVKQENPIAFCLPAQCVRLFQVLQAVAEMPEALF